MTNGEHFQVEKNSYRQFIYKKKDELDKDYRADA